MSDTPARFRSLCVWCSDPVDIRPGRGGYREVAGWEPLRHGGGGNTVKLPVRTGRYAHATCLEVERTRPKGWEQLSMEDL